MSPVSSVAPASSAREKLDPSVLSIQLEGLGDVDIQNLALIPSDSVSIPIEERILDATIERTIEGASTLQLNISDYGRTLLKAGNLGDKVDVHLDGLWFRLVKVAKQDDVLQLVFEDREVAILRTYNTYKTAARGKVTRAQFAKSLITEVKELQIPFFSPELNVKQPIKSSKDIPHQKVRNNQRDYGFPKNSNFTVKGQQASAAQREAADTVLKVGHSMNARRKVLVSAIMVGIHESSITNLPTGPGEGDTMSKGVFQQKPRWWSSRGGASGDTASDAHAYFESAIAADQKAPNESIGDLACDAQVVPKPQFSADFERYLTEAQQIVNAWGIFGGDTEGDLFISGSAGTQSKAVQGPPAVFSGEGPPFYSAAYAVYSKYAVPGPYQEALTSGQETSFRAWVTLYSIPFDVTATTVDYDMRGYWLATSGAPHTAGDHFPDTYKTPYDTTFSKESKYATPDNPFTWEGERLINSKTGVVMFGPPKTTTVQVAVDNYQFERGSKTKDSNGNIKITRENTWDALGRLADEVNWRRFVVSGTVYFISEQQLFKSQPRMTLTEDSDGVDRINFDYDVGKHNASVTVTCRADRWEAPPGTVILLDDLGPCNGRWLVTNIRRGLLGSTTTITLKKPLPKLPEPVATSSTSGVGGDINTTAARYFKTHNTGVSANSGVKGTLFDPGGPIRANVAPDANRPGVALNPKVVDFVSRISNVLGTPLTITTGTNHREFVQGEGNTQSEHWVGNAADIASLEVNLLPLGRAALIAAGAPEAWANKQTGGWFNVNGFNILFNTYTGGNHFNHLHVGIGRALKGEGKGEVIRGGS